MNPTSIPSQAAATAQEAATRSLIEKARDHLGSAVVSDVLDAAGLSVTSTSAGTFCRVLAGVLEAAGDKPGGGHELARAVIRDRRERAQMIEHQNHELAAQPYRSHPHAMA